MKSLLQFPRSFGLIATTPLESTHYFGTAQARPTCHLLGDNENALPSETHRFGAEICHLLGDMSLEDDCA